MVYKSRRIKELMQKIKLGTATPKEKQEYKELTATPTEGENLSRISGMKGAEKSIKDKIGRNLNMIDRNSIVDKAMKRMNSSRDNNNDS